MEYTEVSAGSGIFQNLKAPKNCSHNIESIKTLHSFQKIAKGIENFRMNIAM